MTEKAQKYGRRMKEKEKKKRKEMERKEKKDEVADTSHLWREAKSEKLNPQPCLQSIKTKSSKVRLYLQDLSSLSWPQVAKASSSRAANPG